MATAEMEVRAAILDNFMRIAKIYDAEIRNMFSSFSNLKWALLLRKKCLLWGYRNDIPNSIALAPVSSEIKRKV